MKNIKQLRKELRAWGRFWRAKQLNECQSVSITEKVCDMLRKGVFSNSVPGGAFGHSESIYVPTDYQELDYAIEKLSVQCRIAIVQKHIKDQNIYGYWIDQAESRLLGALFQP